MKSYRARYVMLFVGIMLTTALGTTFMTERQRVEQEEQYMAQTQAFYELAIISDIGFSEQDLLQIQENTSVSKAEGSFSFPILVTDESGFASRKIACSLAESVNIPTLKEGRLPQGKGECAIAEENSAERIGDIVTYERNGEEIACEIVGKVFFPFSLEEAPPKQIFYFQGDAFDPISFSRCDLILNLNENFLEPYKEELYKTKEAMKKQAVESAEILEKEANEKQKKLATDFEKEKDTLLAKQKALGKIELKIDQDEANRYDKEQIANRRKEIERQKAEIAQKRGEYNKTYQKLRQEALLAKERADEARASADSVQIPQIHAVSKEDNQAYLSFVQTQKENRREQGIPLLFLFVMVLLSGLAIANSMLGERKLWTMIITAGGTAFVASILGFLVGGGLQISAEYLVMVTVGMTLFTVFVHILSYYGERKCIRRKQIGNQTIWQFITIQIVLLSLLFASNLLFQKSVIATRSLGIAFGGSIVVFYLLSYAKIKKSIWQSIVGKDKEFSPSKSIGTVMRGNYKLLVPAILLSAGSIVLSDKLTALQPSVFWESYAIAIFLSLTGMTMIHIMLYVTMRNLTK